MLFSGTRFGPASGHGGANANPKNLVSRLSLLFPSMDPHGWVSVIPLERSACLAKGPHLKATVSLVRASGRFQSWTGLVQRLGVFDTGFVQIAVGPLGNASEAEGRLSVSTARSHQASSPLDGIRWCPCVDPYG